MFGAVAGQPAAVQVMIFIVLVVLLCALLVIWNNMKSRGPSPPVYPGALPLIGHAHQCYGDSKHFWEVLKNLSHFSLENGGVVEVWMGPHIMYMITDPDDSMIVATKCMEKPYFYEFATEMFKNGLITASCKLPTSWICIKSALPSFTDAVSIFFCISATTWKTHRRLLNPSFNQQVMTSFLPEFNTQARNLVVSLQSEVGKELFDIHQYLIKQLLKTVCQTSLGLATEDKTIDVDYANATEDLFATLAERFTRIYLHLSYTYAWNVKFEPLLNQLLELADTQDAFSDDEIREHVDTVVAAAYDTTATTITFVLIMLGTYPEVQNRVYKEIQSVLGDEDADLTKDNLPKLVYLDAVLKETLRLYPPSPCVARRIDSDVKLKNYTLRSGATCILSIYGMSRHAMWGADADQFKPERWLDPSALPNNPNVFCTFSLGKRNCIGRVYAMLAMKTMLVHVLRKYIVFGDVNSVTTQFTISFKPATASQLLLVVLFCASLALWNKMKPRPPSPPVHPGALPLIGHAHQFYGDPKHLWEFVTKLSHFSLKSGGVSEIWMGPHIMYITTWKTHRRLLNPSFNLQVLTSFIPEFNTQARNLVVSLQSEVGKESFNVHHYLIKQLLKTVCQTSLGLATEDKSIDVDYANATEDLFAILSERFTRIYLHLSSTYAWSSLKTKQDQLLKITRGIMNKIIYRRKEELKMGSKTENGTSAKVVKFEPLLNQLLELADTQDAFTDDEIREHVNTIVAAAYDTTASSITFALILLGTYPEVQNRVYKEIQTVLGDEDLTKDNLPKLVYLEAVVKETLRLYPSSPCVARRIDSDVKLKNYTLRSGTTCLLSIYGIGRHSMWGADADQFKPERWLDPSALPSNPNAFCNFGIGKRDCIGRVYAMLAIKTMLVHVLRKYIVFGDVNSIKAQLTISFKPATTSQLRLELRS
ncbi:hypothetical protein SFRURICE_012767 [Spodoptera frugiperda]|nr:hypothetical protein SFRURICE_012767 [Spodoptera frugiperda]